MGIMKIIFTKSLHDVGKNDIEIFIAVKDTLNTYLLQNWYALNIFLLTDHMIFSWLWIIYNLQINYLRIYMINLLSLDSLFCNTFRVTLYNTLSTIEHYLLTFISDYIFSVRHLKCGVVCSDWIILSEATCISYFWDE